MARKKAAPKNKVLGNISKKTIGKKVDTVADYVDILSQMVVEYFNQRYKIQQKVGDIRRATIQTMFNLKREVMKSLVEAIFLTTGFIALIAGVILIVSKAVPMEYVFVGYGLIASIVVLYRMRLQA